MKRSNPKQQQALQLLRGGYSVIPVRNKRSLFQWKEFQEHRPTEAQVEAWWVEYPDADIAVICGKVSGGLTVIDIDNLEIAKRFKGKEFIKRTRGGGNSKRRVAPLFLGHKSESKNQTAT